MLKLIVYICIIKSVVFCWKPISSPTAFSITQQHPSISLQSSTNNLIDSDIERFNNGDHKISTTYHGNVFPTSHDSTPSFIGSDSINAGHFASAASLEGRILSHKVPTNHYGSKLLDGFLQPTVNDGHCSTDKYALNHEGTLQFDHAIPKLDQFTLCSWMRFTNHSGDHSIFTYSVDHEPREIQFWVANTMGSSYFSLAVHGQSLYRLNYPLKMRRWHHACTSWNGKTGEWQLWIKAERVGRGFTNRLVGHVIKSNGIVFSGGPSITGPVSDGLHMEITMVQLYKVALSAGKAHRDHKHHHVHHFNHDGLAPTTPAPPTPSPPPVQQSGNPALANGQITTRLRINLAGVQPQMPMMVPGSSPGIPVQGLPSQLAGNVFSNAAQQQQQQQQQASVGTNFVSGQFSSAERFISQQLAENQIQARPQSTFTFPQQSQQPQQLRFNSNPANVQFIDDELTNNAHSLFKRHNNEDAAAVVKDNSKTINKRALVTLTDGSVIDDKIIAENPFDFDGLAQFGAPAFKEYLNKMMDIEDEIRHHDREPAEGEVQAVLQLCSSCDVEPFQAANILSWRSVNIQTENALKALSKNGCGDF